MNFEPIFSVPVVRGCGTRKKGGAYVDVGVDEDGTIPIYKCLIDSPVPVDTWDIPKRGVSLTERDGVFHIIDWVGYKYYPNPCDFYEELARYGLSRRIPSSFDFSKLSRESRILLVHPRAYIENLDDLVGALGDENQPRSCLTGEHVEPYDAIMADEDEMMCVSYWYKACSGAKDGLRVFTDNVKYKASPWPSGFKPEYRPALFASLPAASIVVVGDDKKADETYSKVAIARENGCFITRVEK